MKYAINFHRDFRYFDNIDEIIIKVKEKNVSLLEFMNNITQEQRIIIDMTNIDSDAVIDMLKEIKVAATAHKNLTLRLGHTQQAAASVLYEENIPYFFDELVDTWDKLVALVSLQVSDVYIVSDLGFDLPRVSAFCKKNNVKIRVFPNVSQVSNSMGKIDKFKGFFIRPEDIKTYEQYVDICEFWGELDRQSVYYEIYNIQKKWRGELKDLILNLDLSVHNKTLPPIFGDLRAGCQKKCYQGQCNKCERMLETAKLLKENNLLIRNNKEES